MQLWRMIGPTSEVQVGPLFWAASAAGSVATMMTVAIPIIEFVFMTSLSEAAFAQDLIVMSPAGQTTIRPG